MSILNNIINLIPFFFLISFSISVLSHRKIIFIVVKGNIILFFVVGYI